MRARSKRWWGRDRASAQNERVRLERAAPRASAQSTLAPTPAPPPPPPPPPPTAFPALARPPARPPSASIARPAAPAPAPPAAMPAAAPPTSAPCCARKLSISGMRAMSCGRRKRRYRNSAPRVAGSWHHRRKPILHVCGEGVGGGERTARARMCARVRPYARSRAGTTTEAARGDGWCGERGCPPRRSTSKWECARRRQGGGAYAAAQARCLRSGRRRQWQRRPPTHRVGEDLEQAEDGEDDPVGQPLRVVVLSRALDGLEAGVGREGEADEAAEELHADADEEEEQRAQQQAAAEVGALDAELPRQAR
jgi:hypothetical protein